jgi:hypothetical protein
MASPTQIGLSAHAEPHAPTDPVRYIGFLLATGLVNALIAGFFFVHLPDARQPSLVSLTLRATIYVLIGALAGTSGPWFYWRRPNSPFLINPPLRLLQFVLCGAVGWVWVPAIVLLAREDSPLSAPIAILGAGLLAIALRRALPAEPPIPATQPHQLFADTLRTPPRQLHGYFLSASIYIAAYDLATGWILTACALLSGSIFLIAWKLTLPPSKGTPASTHTRRGAWRLASVVIPAILVTLFALIHGVGHRAQLEAVAAQSRANPHGRAAKPSEDTPASATGIAGYHSIILWPEPQRHDIQPPIPALTSVLAPGTTKPLIIKFDGPYFYFQMPNKRPAPNALQVHGTPIAHDFQSNNFIPLVMEAHQTLGRPIPIARLREIELDILNGDNRPGPISIALLLTDSASPNNQLYLGQEPVLTSQPGSFAVKSAPAAETLRFQIPNPAKLRRFDQITVMVLPDSSNYDQGSKVAVEQFQLIPR